MVRFREGRRTRQGLRDYLGEVEEDVTFVSTSVAARNTRTGRTSGPRSSTPDRVQSRALLTLTKGSDTRYTDRRVEVSTQCLCPRVERVGRWRFSSRHWSHPPTVTPHRSHTGDRSMSRRVPSPFCRPQSLRTSPYSRDVLEPGIRVGEI